MWESTIIVGDKFGDVYSLPLLPTPNWSRKSTDKPIDDFKPSATELTVHTKGNLEALRQQRERRQVHVKKEGPDFEHTLLLGHVSLLTALAITSVPEWLSEPEPDREPYEDRDYIVTCDRDEHIRISRGIPQTHIIENYIHGHKEFISKLFIGPQWNERLIVGSGEPTLKIYKLPSGSTLFELDLRLLLETAIETYQLSISNARLTDKIAVSGIWEAPLPVQDGEPPSEQHFLVALEG